MRLHPNSTHRKQSYAIPLRADSLSTQHGQRMRRRYRTSLSADRDSRWTSSHLRPVDRRHIWHIVKFLAKRTTLVLKLHLVFAAEEGRGRAEPVLCIHTLLGNQVNIKARLSEDLVRVKGFRNEQPSRLALM